VDSTVKKKSGWIFFIANTLIVLFCLLRKVDSVIELVFLALGILALWAILVKCAEKSVNAIDRVPVILFMDSMILFAVNASDWVPSLQKPIFMFSNKPVQWLFMAIIGFILMMVSIKKNNKIVGIFAYEAWFYSLMVLLGATLNTWSSSEYLRLFGALYLLGNVMWWFIIRLCTVQNVNRAKTTTILQLGLFGEVVFLLGCTPGYFYNILASFQTICDHYAQTILRTRNLVILVLAFMVVAWIFSEEGFTGRQFKGCMIIAGTVCIIKACMTFFVPGGFLSIFVYMGIMAKDLNKHGFNDDSKLGSDIQGLAAVFQKRWQMYYPLIVSTAIIAALFVISIGLWLLVPLGGIFTAIILKSSHRNMRPALIIVFGTIMTLAAMYLYKWNSQNVPAVLAVMVALLILLRFANQKHPSVNLPHTGWKALLCCAGLFLMVLLVARNEVTTYAHLKESWNIIEFGAEEKNEDIQMTEGYYSTEGGYFKLIPAATFDSSEYASYLYSLYTLGKTIDGTETSHNTDGSNIPSILLITVSDDGTCTVTKKYVSHFFSQFTNSDLYDD
jgi:hypothetical protein